MKSLAMGLLAIMLIAGCSADGNVRLVQKTRNAAGIASSNIPDLLFDKLGFKVQSAKWVEEANDGFVKVALKVKAKKVVRGPVYMSYLWSPEWKWSVEKSTGSVIPVNNLAKNWMRGSI